MDPIDQRLLLAFQRLGGRYIGLDHELLDQPVGVEAVGNHHAVDRSVRFQQDFSLRQVEFERIARVASALEYGIAVPQRLQNAVENRRGLLVGLPVDRRLRLRIGELGRRAHDYSMKRMAEFAPLGRENHLHSEGRAVLALAQGAQVVGDALGQHGHDPVGKIDRIAADIGLAVQRRAGADIGGHVGNGDGDDEATLIGGVVIGRGMDGVVVVGRSFSSVGKGCMLLARTSPFGS